jgi:hypothetical protein
VGGEGGRGEGRKGKGEGRGGKRENTDRVRNTQRRHISEVNWKAMRGELCRRWRAGVEWGEVKLRGGGSEVEGGGSEAEGMGEKIAGRAVDSAGEQASRERIMAHANQENKCRRMS